MNIVIMGAPVSCGNRGVLALGTSLATLCIRASSESNLLFLVPNRTNDPVTLRIAGQLRKIPVVNLRLSPRAALSEHLLWIVLMSVVYRCVRIRSVRESIVRKTPWIRAIVTANFVGDIRGGDSFSDIYGLYGFVVSFITSCTVLLVNGTLIHFPQTYGPYNSRLSRWLASFLLRRSPIIIARDRESEKIARELAGPVREILLSPDVAFSLEPIEPAEIMVDPPISGPISKSLIGLNVNAMMYNAASLPQYKFGLRLDYPRFLSELVSTLLSVHDGELWLIPHTIAPKGHLDSDWEACADLRDRVRPELRNRLRLVSQNYNQHELKGLIRHCEFFVGSRMHSCIAALSQGVPCVGVAYSRKFRGVFESVDMKSWVIDAREADSDSARRQIVELYHRRNEVRRDLAQRAESARRDLDAVFDHVLSTVQPTAFARAGHSSQPLSPESSLQYTAGSARDA